MNRIANRFIFFVTISALVGCANQMSRNEALSLQKIAVVNIIEDKLAMANIGVPRFEDSWDAIHIEDWGLSEYLSEKVIDVARATRPQAEFVLVEEDVEENGAKLTSEALARLKSSGFDAALIVSPAGLSDKASNRDMSVASFGHLVPPNEAGFVFITHSVFGNRVRGELCVHQKFILINLDNQKSLRKFDRERCAVKAEGIDFKAYEEYSQSEKKQIWTALVKDVDQIWTWNLTLLGRF